MSNKRKTIIIPDETIEKAKAIQDYFQIGNFTELVKQAISFMYKGTVGNYKEALIQRANKLPVTPMDKAKAEIELREAKEKSKREFQAEICHKMGGEIDNAGFCIYTLYEMSPGPKAPVETSKINTPFMDMTGWDLKNQYRDQGGNPIDKEVILEQIRKHGMRE